MLLMPCHVMVYETARQHWKLSAYKRAFRLEVGRFNTQFSLEVSFHRYIVLNNILVCRSTMASESAVLILGAGPRIGASVAEAFAANGYQVVIAARKGTNSRDARVISPFKPTSPSLNRSRDCSRGSSLSSTSRPVSSFIMRRRSRCLLSQTLSSLSQRRASRRT